MISRRDLFKGLGGAAALAAISSAPGARLLQARAGGDPVRLMYNENAAGASPAAKAAVVGAMDESSLYSTFRDAQYGEALAAYHNLDPATVIQGSGSAEILNNSFLYMLQPGLKVFAPEMSFERVGRLCGIYGVPYVTAPMNDDLTVNGAAIRALAEAHDGPALVYLTSPNNPTGDLIHSDVINSWVRSAPENIFFLLDEAYFEFVTVPGHVSGFELVREGRANVVVTRTFSKVYGMAGVRAGFGAAVPEIARHINNKTGGNNMNVYAQAGAIAALGDVEFYQQSLSNNRRARAITEEALNELDLSFIPGEANFMFHRINADHPEYAKRMLDHGFWVGRMMGGRRDYCRVSMGLPEEMERFAETLLMFRRNGWV